MPRLLIKISIFFFILVGILSCRAPKLIIMHYKERQLTFGASGHTINNIQIFSSSDQWIVFDTRNNDTEISRTGSIEMVDVHTGEIKQLYKTENQTQYGPGVGAATFSPVADRVLFLHGIRNANREHPYDFTRRTGVAVDINKPFQPEFLDARNIIAPYTPGALRGGTHAHSWSADGKWISFTYNDYVLQQLSKKDSTVKDLRTVAVMTPLSKVTVVENGKENNNGEMFSAVVAAVTASPKWGTDEIDRAFDETWIGTGGYQRKDGKWQPHAIAFQGNVYDEKGRAKTEIFVVDIPADITKARPGEHLEGTEESMPATPSGTAQRRITFSAEGVHGPRHWLRSTPDGKLIAFLAKDEKAIVQIYSVSPNGGAVSQLTFNNFSIQSSFNFSPDGKHLAYLADNSIFITDLQTKAATRTTSGTTADEAPTGGVVWSNDGKALAYNRYVSNKEGRFLQIFLLIK